MKHGIEKDLIFQPAERVRKESFSNFHRIFFDAGHAQAYMAAADSGPMHPAYIILLAVILIFYDDFLLFIC